jgi:DNA mismatch endonuclease (patch repair protein)
MPSRTTPVEAPIPFKRDRRLKTTAERSALMGRVRQAKTAPEEAVAAWLGAHGVAYRRNVRALPGRPDFANRAAGFAIFVHGCFWHRHPGCRRATTPSRNRDFWLDKFAANVARDAARTSELGQAGFLTITVWECETENNRALDAKIEPLLGPRHARPSAGKPARGRAEPKRPSPSATGTSVGSARGHRAFARARTEGAGS